MGRERIIMGKSSTMERIRGFKYVKIVLRNNIDRGTGINDKGKGLETKGGGN